MIVHILSTELVEDGKYKVTTKQGVFYSKVNGYTAGEYDIDTKSMMFRGEQVQVITNLTPVAAQIEPAKEAPKPAVTSNPATAHKADDKMSKADWAEKDRQIVKQSVMKAVLGSPGVGMVAHTKDENNIGPFYSKVFKDMMKAYDEVR